MADLHHDYGSDLALSPSGDLLAVDGTTLGEQRVLRRLLTNPGDHVWHLDYGAGLPAYVGQPAQADRIEGTIRRQMRLEAAVSQNPTPVVAVTASPDGTVLARVQYVDADTGDTARVTAAT